MMRTFRIGKTQGTIYRSFFAGGAAACLLLLSSPLIARAGSREAVGRAVAATVAIEWKADKPAEQPAEQQKLHRQTVELRQGRWVSFLKESGAPDLALGSGTLVSAGGLIVAFSPTPAASPESGHHTVTFDDGRTFTARLLVDDRRNGLELLKIDAQDLPHLTPAEDDAQLGDQVYATFATDARQRAAAQGMVAARNQSHKGRAGRLLQVDAKVGRMSAGGPLVDGDGRLVGILVARSASGGGTQGASFAVPAKAVTALIAARQGDAVAVIEHGFLGVQLEQHETDGKSQVIMRPMAESPAAAAGVREGDMLLMIDGETVFAGEDAAAIISQHAPGDTVALVFERDGKREARAITLGKRPHINSRATETGQLPPGPQPAVSAESEDRILFFGEDGKPRIGFRSDGKPLPELEYHRLYGRLAIPNDAPVVSTIRVERSDVEKQLDSVGQNVQSLSEQVKKLTEEVQRLREQLSADAK